MEYIKLFENHTEYETFINGGGVVAKPNVSHCVQENHVHYSPKFHDYSKDYFTIESLEDNNIIYMKAPGSSSTKTVSASTDNGATWTEYISSTGGSGTTLATLNAGEKLLVKGENSGYGAAFVSNRFIPTGLFEVKGNIMSLVSGDSFANADELTTEYAFRGFFAGRTELTSAENLVLRATTLSKTCYGQMFRGCTNITTTPQLPATTLAQGCYSQMFESCTSLTTAPALPATTLANNCYSSMFKSCTSLTAAPELPATTLAQTCYNAMFTGCRSLITAPVLSATTLAQNCCQNMFWNCTSLTTAPELLATTLAEGCYDGMFDGCTSLNYIKCLATDISATNCTQIWVRGVAQSGTFVKNAAMNDWAEGDNGIPTGWTVQDVS